MTTPELIATLKGLPPGLGAHPAEIILLSGEKYFAGTVAELIRLAETYEALLDAAKGMRLYPNYARSVRLLDAIAECEK